MTSNNNSRTRRPPLAPSPPLNRGERHTGRGTGQHATPPPPPSPTWAEVARGGSSRGESSDQTHAQPPAADCNSTPARPIYTSIGSIPLPLPSTHSQYLAWVSCRREGLPARLVLETDGHTEEVCLWFRPAVNSNINGGCSAADIATHKPPSGKRRREHARRRRRREERRREAEENRSPSDTPIPGVATAAEIILSTSPPAASPSPENIQPSSATPSARVQVYKARPLAMKRAKAVLTASRASRRAAVLSKKRGTAETQQSASNDDSTPEKLRGADKETGLNITLGCSSPPPPLSPTPPSPTSSTCTAPAPSMSLPSPSPTAPASSTTQASSTPPPPPPMHAKFPTYYRRVICQECFYDDHDYRYYHCLDCHVNGPPHPEARMRNLRRFAVPQ